MSLRLLKIARQLEKTNPILGYELFQNIQKLSVINPGRQTFEDTVHEYMDILLSLKAELNDVERKFKENMNSEDVKEFAKFFDDQTEVELHELERLVQKTGSTAGFSDWVKGIFKGKKGKPEPEDPDMPASYRMKDEDIDKFVEGEKDWKPSDENIDSERASNRDYESRIKGVISDMEKFREKPSKEFLSNLVDRIDELIQDSADIINSGPSRPVQQEESGIVEEAKDEEEVPPPESKTRVKTDKTGEPKKKESIGDMALRIDHFADILKDVHGDEAKTLKALKDLFELVKPALDEPKEKVASMKKLIPSLVRVAHQHERFRPFLLPAINRIRALP